MNRRSKAIVTAGVAVLGAVLLFGLTVYPFEYGPVESVLLVVAFVLLALFETVLDGALTED